MGRGRQQVPEPGHQDGLEKRLQRDRERGWTVAQFRQVARRAHTLRASAEGRGRPVWGGEEVRGPWGGGCPGGEGGSLRASERTCAGYQGEALRVFGFSSSLNWRGVYFHCESRGTWFPCEVGRLCMWR